MHNILALAFLLVLAAGTSAALVFDPATFPSSSAISPSVTVYWKPDPSSSERVMIAVAARTLGWVAIGWSSNGGMHGADIATYSQVSGVWVLQDRFSPTFSLPLVDDSQDLQLVSGGQDDGWTSFVFLRNVTSCDLDQDAPLLPEGNTVIWATGDRPVLSYHGTDTRGSAYINFLTTSAAAAAARDVALPTDMISLTLQMPNVTVPSRQVDTYVCQVFPLPSDRKYHLMEYSPLLGAAGMTHHMILYGCTSRPARTGTFTCFETPEECAEPVLLWGPGVGTVTYPSAAGLPIGSGHITYVALQVHYNNPALRTGVPDSSGFTIRYSPTLRPNDIGIMTFGLQTSPATIHIPPGNGGFSLNGECPASCTQRYLPPEGVTVISTLLHMHEIGKRSALRLVRGGKELTPVALDEYFDFHYQSSKVPPPQQKLFPGDRLLPWCEWDSSSVREYTNGGPRTHDEMCLQFVSYYPAVPLLYCLNMGRNGTGVMQGTYCSDRDGNATVTPFVVPNSSFAPRDLPRCPSPSTPIPTTSSPLSTQFNYTLWLIPALAMLVIPVVVAIGRHMLEKRYRSLKAQQDLESLSEMHSLSTEEEGDSETLN